MFCGESGDASVLGLFVTPEIQETENHLCRTVSCFRIQGSKAGEGKKDPELVAEPIHQHLCSSDLDDTPNFGNLGDLGFGESSFNTHVLAEETRTNSTSSAECECKCEPDASAEPFCEQMCAMSCIGCGKSRMMPKFTCTYQERRYETVRRAHNKAVGMVLDRQVKTLLQKLGKSNIDLVTRCCSTTTDA